VVLADPDPELRNAMEHALAPWRLEVVIDGSPPADTAMAQQRADAGTARYMVWRDGDQLVVYDRELGFTEKRGSRAGVLDPPTAAAAALTIKTMMRLPPPPPQLETHSPVTADATVAGLALRFQVGIATRITYGIAPYVTARLSGAAVIRPWAAAGWRFGLAGDGGTSASVSHAGFKGTWSEWTVLGIASWTYTHDPWEFEPHAAVGVRRSSLDGADTNVARSEAATLPTARGGMWLRWRVARWTFGAALDVDGTFGTPTYSKPDSPAEIFQVPGVGVELGGVIAADL
jgi:hypothetical protein